MEGGGVAERGIRTIDDLLYHLSSSLNGRVGEVLTR